MYLPGVVLTKDTVPTDAVVNFAMAVVRARYENNRAPLDGKSQTLHQAICMVSKQTLTFSEIPYRRTGNVTLVSLFTRITGAGAGRTAANEAFS